MGKALITTKHLPYEKWIQEWTSQPTKPANTMQVPAAAIRITSPLIVDNWHIMLANYPNTPLVNFFILAVQEGFHLGFTSCTTRVKSAKWNLQCALDHPEVVESYLADEVTLGHIQVSSVPHALISRFGVIPKNQQPNKWQLIVDLSHQKSRTVVFPKNFAL